jgi:hypothetical protein
MTALAICVVALVACYLAGKRSLGLGLAVLMLFGYVYGILRANLLTTSSHFIFDSGVLGLYLSQKWLSSDPRDDRRTEAIRLWLILLVGWCVLVAFMPFQPWLVTIVGFRGNVFFLPALLLGARLKDKDVMQLSCGFAVLNLLALALALIEYSQGVPRFYPRSPVTDIIYRSADVAGGYFRIPAIFTSAHAYGGTMVCSLPYLVGAWNRTSKRHWQLLLFAGAGAAMLGILLSATRVNFILGSVILLTAISVRNRSRKTKVILVLLIAAVGWTAVTNTRLQRFKTLGDTSYVEDRIAGSVNRGFFEILLEYPMGNGLGGGGTSLPYFLASQVRNPIGMENEYARILCEQGIVGLLLWIGFIGWFLCRAPMAFQPSEWRNSRRIVWCFLAFTLGTMWAGVGFFTSIPQTVIQLLGMGWTANPPVPEDRPRLTLRPAPRRRTVPTSTAAVRA